MGNFERGGEVALWAAITVAVPALQGGSSQAPQPGASDLWNPMLVAVGWLGARAGMSGPLTWAASCLVG